MSFSVVCAHGYVFARDLTEIEAHGKFKNTDCGPRKVLECGIAWNMHHSHGILLPLGAEGKGLSRWPELKVCYRGCQVHDCLCGSFSFNKA